MVRRDLQRDHANLWSRSHACVARIEILHAQIETNATGALLTHHRVLMRCIGLGEYAARRATPLNHRTTRCGSH